MDLKVASHLPLGTAEIRPTTAGGHSSPEIRRAHHALTLHVAERLSRVGVDDLDDAIDELLLDEEYVRQRGELSAMLPWNTIQEAIQNGPAPVPDVPPSVQEAATLAAHVEYELIRHSMRVLGVLGSIFPPKPPRADLDVDLDSIRGLLASDMPAFMRAAFIAHRVGEVASYAIQSGRISSPTLAKALVEKWIHGSRSTLATFNMFAPSQLAPDILPQDYVMDLQTEFEKDRNAARGAAIADAEVRKTGKGYPAVYLADDDDQAR